MPIYFNALVKNSTENFIYLHCTAPKITVTGQYITDRKKVNHAFDAILVY